MEDPWSVFETVCPSLVTADSRIYNDDLNKIEEKLKAAEFKYERSTNKTQAEQKTAKDLLKIAQEEAKDLEKLRKRVSEINHKQRMTQFECIECKGQKQISGGFLTCCQCGLIDMSSNISTKADWNSGVSETGTSTDGNRCGMSIDTTLHSTHWQTGTRISGNSRLARRHFHSSMDHRQRELYHTYKEFDAAARVLHINANVNHKAKVLYNNFIKLKIILRADVRKGFKANCLFWVAKSEGIPRTTKEVAEAFHITSTDVGRTAHIIPNYLKIQQSKKNIITGPEHVIMRMLQYFDDLERVHKVLCENACKFIKKEPLLMCKTPKGVASAVIYVIFDGVISKQEIVKKCETTMTTLNNLIPIVQEALKEFDF